MVSPLTGQSGEKVEFAIDLTTDNSSNENAFDSNIIEIHNDDSDVEYSTTVIGKRKQTAKRQRTNNTNKRSGAIDSRTRDDAVIVQILSDESPSKKRPYGESSLFHCDICLDDALEAWRGYHLANCQHRFCLACLSTHIKSSSTASVSPRLSIQCPKCPQSISLSDIRSIFIAVGDKQAWRIYTEKASTALLEEEIVSASNNKNVNNAVGVTRRCPAETCNFTFVFESATARIPAPVSDYNSESVFYGEGSRFDCPLCQQSFCLQCGANQGQVGPAHDDSSCYDRHCQLIKEEEERKKLELWKKENAQADARFQQLLEIESMRGITKKCPRCKVAVTKNGGCNHMTCRCGHEYNWTSATG